MTNAMVDRMSVVLGRWLALPSVLAFAVGTAGCGGSQEAVPGTASCTISQTLGAAGGMLSQRICEESMGLSAAQVQQLMQQCMIPGGGPGGAGAGFSQQAMFAPAPCSRDGALGGCRVVQAGMTVTAWYYEMGTFTSADIQQLCTLAGETFVMP